MNRLETLALFKSFKVLLKNRSYRDLEEIVDSVLDEIASCEEIDYEGEFE